MEQKSGPSDVPGDIHLIAQHSEHNQLRIG